MNGYEVEKKFLAIGNTGDDLIRMFWVLASDLPGDKYAATRTRLYATLQEYLLANRAELLKGMDLTPETISRVNPDQATMMKLNAISGFYGADRVTIHLYLNAHLINEIAGTPERMQAMDDLVDKLYVS